MPPQKHDRSGKTSSTLQHHSPGGSGDFDLQLLCRLASIRWILVWGNLVHDTTTTMPGPCSEKSASPQEGSGHRGAAGVPSCGTQGVHRSFFPFKVPGRSLRATSLSLQEEPANIGMG